MSDQNSKAQIIDERQANLPLPEDPPTASDWNSSDSRTVGKGSGGEATDVSTGNGSTAGLEGAATKASGVRDANGVNLSGIGREGKEGQ